MEDLNPPIAIAGSERPSGNEDQLGEQPVGITSSAAPLQEGSRAFETQVLSALIDTMERMRMDRQEGEGAGHSARAGANDPKEWFPRTFFGINQRFDQGQFRMDNEDYEQAFPEDAYGEECGPNARVFKVYHQEATTYDNDMISQLSDSSDVLLVFAGLFSAVLTTFVVQTSQALETDKSAISNSLLSEIVELQRAQANGTSFGDVERAITETTPSSTDIWVNGLWFTSLTLSLATALFAVLTKQWLRHYVSTTSGTIRERCLIRQFRFMGMQKWHVVTIIGVLPILLHISLGVFFAGLTVFLIPRSLPLACIVGIMVIIIYSLYFITNLLPVINIQCPYRTPFSEILNITGYQFQLGVQSTQRAFIRVLNSVHAFLHFPCIPQRTHLRWVWNPSFARLRDQECSHVGLKEAQASLMVDVLAWLMDISSNPSVRSVAVQAVGGLPLSQRSNVARAMPSTKSILPDLIDQCLSISSPRRSWYQTKVQIEEGSIRPGFTRRLERLARACPIFMDSWNMCQAISYDFYTAFKSLNNLEWRASALPCFPHDDETPHPDILELITCLIGSPDVRLSSNAWINVTSTLIGNLTSEFKLAMCQMILEDENLRRREDHKAVVTIGVVLLRQQPELLVQLFGGNPDSLSSPNSHCLHGLLTLQYFIVGIYKSQSPSDESALNLTCKVWDHISFHLSSTRPTLNDCYAVFHAINRTLSWGSQTELDLPYMEHIMNSYRRASVYTYQYQSEPPPLDWSCFEQVVGKSISDIRTETFWQDALCDGIHDAYTTFVNNNVLACYPSIYLRPGLVKAFVSGLVREHRSDTWTTRLPMELYSRCLGYLHEPEHIFATCKILLLSVNDPWETRIATDVLALAQLDPQNDTWTVCLTKLCEWQEVTSDLGKDTLEALSVLHSFFKKRRRHGILWQFFNPLTAVRPSLGGFARPTDIEQQDTAVVEIPLAEVSRISSKRTADSMVPSRSEEPLTAGEEV